MVFFLLIFFTFCYQSFLSPSISSFSSLPTGKQTTCRWSGKEVENKEESWPIRREDKLGGKRLLAARRETWEEINGVAGKLKVDQLIPSTNHSYRQIGSLQAVRS